MQDTFYHERQLLQMGDKSCFLHVGNLQFVSNVSIPFHSQYKKFIILQDKYIFFLKARLIYFISTKQELEPNLPDAACHCRMSDAVGLTCGYCSV